MDDKKINKVSFESKKTFKLPPGAKIVSKEVRLSVEEIENGFILSKTYDISYIPKGSEHKSYEYFTKRHYSETNPLVIDDSLDEDFL